MKSLQTQPRIEAEAVHGSDRVFTKEDFNEFKADLLIEFKQLFNEYFGKGGKRWMKAAEVRAMLDISPNTLKNLRLNGTLPSTKIGGVYYFDMEDIQASLRNHKVQAS